MNGGATFLPIIYIWIQNEGDKVTRCATTGTGIYKLQLGRALGYRALIIVFKRLPADTSFGLVLPQSTWNLKSLAEGRVSKMLNTDKLRDAIEEAHKDVLEHCTKQWEEAIKCRNENTTESSVPPTLILVTSYWLPRKMWKGDTSWALNEWDPWMGPIAALKLNQSRLLESNFNWLEGLSCALKSTKVLCRCPVACDTGGNDWKNNPH